MGNDSFLGGEDALARCGRGISGRVSEPGRGRFGGKGDVEFRILRADGRGKVKDVV